MDAFANLLGGFSVALQPEYLLWAAIGAVLGTAIGVLPGLGAAVTISILLPVTFAIGDPLGAMIMFAGIFYGSVYGGSTTSILLNTPGVPSAVVATFDGYPMAKQGRGGPALATAAIGGWIGTTVATVGLALLAIPMVSVALRFSSGEFLALMVLALTFVSTLGGKPAKAAFATLIGLALGVVGVDAQTGTTRLTFGMVELYDGINFIVAAVGLFAVSEVLAQMASLRGLRATKSTAPTVGTNVYMNKDEWKASAWPWARGSVVGFIIGVLPGAGASIASFMSYGVEKRIAKVPGRFGRGAIEGVAGPEAANNASAGAAMIPLLTLGIPGSATTAVMLSGFQGFGIRTGPLLFQENPELVWGLIASFILANAMMLALNLPLIRMWIKILDVPPSVLYPMVLVMSSIGVYSLNRNVFDLYLMLGLGVFGFLCRRVNIPMGPLVLGLILGPLMEVHFRRGLSSSVGDWGVFIASGISKALWILVLAMILLPVLNGVRKSLSTSETDGVEETGADQDDEALISTSADVRRETDDIE